MKLAISFGHGLNPSEVVRAAKLSEDAGYDAVWVSESTGYDSLAVLAAIAFETKRIGIGSGIVNIYSRTSTQIAMAAATIDEISGGRFTLGLGASSRSVVSNWHEIEYGKNLARMRNVISEIRAKLGKGSKASSLAFRPRQEIPIVVATVQEKMIKLAREVAEGALFFLRPVSYLRNEAQSLASEKFNLYASVVTCVSSDSRRSEDIVRRTVAFYIAYGDSYREFILKHRPEVADSIQMTRDEWLKGRREEACKRISKELLDELTIFGTPQECQKKLEQDYFPINGLSAVALQFNAGEGSVPDSIKMFANLASSCK